MSVSLSCASSRKKLPFKSPHGHLFSKASYYAKKNKKRKAWWRLHWLQLLTSGFGRLREHWNFSGRASKRRPGCQKQQNPAAGKSKGASHVVPTNQRQSQQREETTQQVWPCSAFDPETFEEKLVVFCPLLKHSKHRSKLCLASVL